MKLRHEQGLRTKGVATAARAEVRAALEAELSRKRPRPRRIVNLTADVFAVEGVAFKEERRPCGKGQTRALLVSTEGQHALNRKAGILARDAQVELAVDPSMLSRRKASALFDDDIRRVVGPNNLALRSIHHPKLHHELAHVELTCLRAATSPRARRSQAFLGGLEAKKGRLPRPDPAVHRLSAAASQERVAQRYSTWCGLDEDRAFLQEARSTLAPKLRRAVRLTDRGEPALVAKAAQAVLGGLEELCDVVVLAEYLAAQAATIAVHGLANDVRFRSRYDANEGVRRATATIRPFGKRAARLSLYVPELAPAKSRASAEHKRDAMRSRVELVAAQHLLLAQRAKSLHRSLLLLSAAAQPLQEGGGTSTGAFRRACTRVLEQLELPFDRV